MLASAARARLTRRSSSKPDENEQQASKMRSLNEHVGRAVPRYGHDMSTRILHPISNALRFQIIRAIGASALSSASLVGCGGKVTIDDVDASDPTGASTSSGTTSGSSSAAATSGGSGGYPTTGVAGTGGWTGTTSMATSTTAASGSGGASAAGGRSGVGGVAGVGGSGGVAGAGGSNSKGPYVCYKSAEIQTKCSGGLHICRTDGGVWDPDGGFFCPDRIGVPDTCQVYEGLVPKGTLACCYLTPAPPNPACGRPFLVEGTARRAALTARADWFAGEGRPDDLEMDPITCGALARAWLDDARSEHASIASFARFTLELLAWGAPSHLVADAQRAAADEIDHARRCFSLASRYAKKAFGPGPLALHGRLFASSLAAAAAATVKEGCVGETIGAVQASYQHAQACDPSVRAALAVVAADEARHAELAWRFVGWALSAGGDAVRAAVTRAFDEACAEVRARTCDTPLAVDATLWRAHGRLSADEQRSSLFDALERVVEPCRRALFEASVRPGPKVELSV